MMCRNSTARGMQQYCLERCCDGDLAIVVRLQMSAPGCEGYWSQLVRPVNQVSKYYITSPNFHLPSVTKRMPRIKVIWTNIMIFRTKGYQNKTLLAFQVDGSSHPENPQNIKCCLRNKFTDAKLNGICHPRSHQASLLYFIPLSRTLLESENDYLGPRD